MKIRSRILSPSVALRIAITYAAVLLAGTPSTARAAGVVGAGTAASCTDAALNTALADGGFVTFNCGGPTTIDISPPQKTIAADTTIDGAALITIRGGHFTVNPGVEFTVQSLTIADNGSIAIYVNGGSLAVTHSIFTGNTALPFGGAIVMVGNGPLSVADSTFTGNSGAIALTTSGNGPGGAATVSNSTFAGNDAGNNDGGGIENLGWTLAVTNSTFIGNRSGAGGGIENVGGTLTVINCTFAGNNGQVDGGAINNIIDFSGSAGPVTVTNSIFSGNTDNSGNPSDNCGSRITDGGHNLDDGTSCRFSAAKGSLSNTAPDLDPAGLQDKGGPTQTVALCTAAGVPAGCSAASPAIDAGDEAICTAAPVNNRDQRGFVRPGAGHTRCSIGAYEADATAPAACVGDCSGTSTVAINDLITLVNIALGTAQPSACANGVPSGGEVNIALIIKAVNNALNGCG
jgi:hypothetical protein